MGYLPNVITSGYQSAANAINNAISNAGDAIQGEKKGVQVAERLVTQAAAKVASYVATVNADGCNVIVDTIIGQILYRNPACNPKPTNQINNSPSSSILSQLPSQDCNITIGLAQTIYFYQDGTVSTLPGVDQLIFGDISYTENGAATQFYTADGTLYVQQLVPSALGGSFRDPLPDAAIEAYPGIRYAELNGVVLTKNTVLGESGLTLWNNYNNGLWYIVQIFEGGSCVIPKDDNPSLEPPPPPKPKKKECCMCCEDNKNSNNDALLKLLLQRVGNLPASVPDNFAAKVPVQITLNSLAEMIIWQAKQMDALAGSYPMPITIKADPTDPKSKDQKLSLPNQAEMLAEILGILVTTKRDTHATLIGMVKTLTEAGMIKNLATQTYDIAHANAEFLGYKLEQVTRTIPCLFTPNAQDIPTFLTAGNISITSYENKDTTDLQDDMKTLLTMASRWNAQNWRQVGTDALSDLKKNLLTNVQAVADTHQAITQPTFQQFCTEAQQGFTKVSGVTDATDPWGAPANEAPTVKQIGAIVPNGTVTPIASQQKIAAEAAAAKEQQSALTGLEKIFAALE